MRRIRVNLALALSVVLILSSVSFSFGDTSQVNDYDLHWAKSSIEDSIEMGITQGYPDGSFRPNNKITRAEFITMVNKAFNIEGSDFDNFSDVPNNSWYYDEILKAKNANYITGYGNNTIRPDAPISRQEVAVILSKLKELESDSIGASEFTDSSRFPSWSIGFIGAVRNASIMNGYPSGEFGYDREITRAEAITVLMNSVDVVIENESIPEDAVVEKKKSSGGNSGNSKHSSDDKVDITTDFDGDGLSDYEEENIYFSDKSKKDTDGDRINDGDEVIVLGTDPIKIDTDCNSVTDDLEDFDDDSIINYDELLLGTDPHEKDTDYDGLSDYREVNETKTNPLYQDSDYDDLSDGKELELGLDPLDYDTDDDGIKDGDEKFDVEIKVSDIESDENVEPSLKINIEGKNIELVEITNVGESNPYLGTSIPGYIGSPYEFSSPEKFDSAEMTFKFDKDLLLDDSFEPAIYYFNPDTNLLELLPEQTIDEVNGTVTVTVTHFSIYMMLNKKAVETFWNKEMSAPIETSDSTSTDVDLVLGFIIDSSGSMIWNDPDDLRKETAKNFTDKMDSTDQAAVIDFDENVEVFCSLTSNKAVIKAAINKIDSIGSTNLSVGVEAGINEIKGDPSKAKYLILLTDGDGYYDTNLTQIAIDEGIKIFTIGLGSGVDVDKLKGIAESTGGKYYHADSSGELVDVFDQTSEEVIDLTLDEDGDGLSDYHEKRGMRTNIGWLYTEWDNPDTDGDGILDGEEVEYVPSKEEEEGIGTPCSMSKYGYFNVKSNPTLADSDWDGIDDAVKVDDESTIFKKFRDPVTGEVPTYTIVDDGAVVYTDKEPMVFTVTDRTLALVASLSYSNLDGYTGKSIGSLMESGFEFENMTTDQLNAIKNARIIHANDSGKGIVLGTLRDIWDNGLGSVAVRIYRSGKKDAIIYGTRGTEPNDDAVNDFSQDSYLSIGLKTRQSDRAVKEYIKITEKYSNAQFYLGGHSLGGRLTQEVFYRVLDKNDGILTFFKQDIPVPTHVATFNALGYNDVHYVLLKNSILSDIEDNLNNYYYKDDLVGNAVGCDFPFSRIGTDYGPWIAKKNGRKIEYEQEKFYKLTGYSFKTLHGIEIFCDDEKLARRLKGY